MSIESLIIRERTRLEDMIMTKVDYEKILKQSQKLDKLLNKLTKKR